MEAFLLKGVSGYVICLVRDFIAFQEGNLAKNGEKCLYFNPQDGKWQLTATGQSGNDCWRRRNDLVDEFRKCYPAWELFALHLDRKGFTSLGTRWEPEKVNLNVTYGEDLL